MPWRLDASAILFEADTLGSRKEEESNLIILKKQGLVLWL